MQSSPIEQLDSAVDMPLRARLLGAVLAQFGGAIPILIITVSRPASRTLLHLLALSVVIVSPFISMGLSNRWKNLRFLASLAALPALAVVQAGSGGIGSPTVLVLWFVVVAMVVTGSDRQAVVAVATAVACCVVPMFVWGEPLYPCDVPLALAVSLTGVAIAGTVGALRHETRRLAWNLSHQADTDPMTGVLNRRGWERRAESVFHDDASTPGASDVVTVAVIDLDGLKQLNDRDGHAAGDTRITTTARVLVETVRTDDLVARLGGDEFALLMTGADVDAATATLDRIRDSLGPETGFSAGVTTMERGERPEDVIRRADRALYDAKRAGRGRTCVATATPSATVESRAGSSVEPSVETEPRPGVAPDVPAVADVDDSAAVVASRRR